MLRLLVLEGLAQDFDLLKNENPERNQAVQVENFPDLECLELAFEAVITLLWARSFA